MLTLEEQHALIEDNIQLAGFIAKRYRWMVPDHEFSDVMSLAYLALVKAARYYNPERCKFSTYAARCMVREFGDANGKLMQKSQIPKARLLSIDKSLDKSLPDFSDLKMQDALGLPRFEDEALDRVMTQDALDKLNDSERELLINYFWREMTQLEIAHAGGITHQRVQQKLKKAIAKIQTRTGIAM